MWLVADGRLCVCWRLLQCEVAATTLHALDLIQESIRRVLLILPVFSSYLLQLCFIFLFRHHTTQSSCPSSVLRPRRVKPDSQYTFKSFHRYTWEQRFIVMTVSSSGGARLPTRLQHMVLWIRDCASHSCHLELDGLQFSHIFAIFSRATVPVFQNFAICSFSCSHAF